jgi:hypothetical protein
MNKILQLKHWQVFIILMLPFFFRSSSTIGAIISMLWCVLWIAWIMIIGVAAYNKLPTKYPISKSYFEVSGIFVIGYFVIIAIVFDGSYSINEGNYKHYGDSTYWILPLHFYLIWSILYVFYFAAKMLISATEGKALGFERAFPYFVAFWFFPVGVWFIQPKAQNLISNDLKVAE